MSAATGLQGVALRRARGAQVAAVARARERGSRQACSASWQGEAGGRRRASRELLGRVGVLAAHGSALRCSREPSRARGCFAGTGAGEGSPCTSLNGLEHSGASAAVAAPAGAPGAGARRWCRRKSGSCCRSSKAWSTVAPVQQKKLLQELQGLERGGRAGAGAGAAAGAQGAGAARAGRGAGVQLHWRLAGRRGGAHAAAVAQARTRTRPRGLDLLAEACRPGRQHRLPTLRCPLSMSDISQRTSQAPCPAAGAARSRSVALLRAWRQWVPGTARRPAGRPAPAALTRALLCAPGPATQRTPRRCSTCARSRRRRPSGGSPRTPCGSPSTGCGASRLATRCGSAVGTHDEALLLTTPVPCPLLGDTRKQLEVCSHARSWRNTPHCWPCATELLAKVVGGPGAGPPLRRARGARPRAQAGAA